MSRKYDVTAMAYDRKGRLLAVGKNSYVKTHPLQAKFAKKAGKEHAVYLHAELSALLKSRSPVHKLIVFRHDSAGNPANAKPCASCQLAIKHFGVKYVEHT